MSYPIKTNITLPDKPSELIRLAIKDLNEIELSSDYIIDMGEWHRVKNPKTDAICYVCFAGAVMANTLKVDHNLYVCPIDFDEERSDITKKLYALNLFREGDIVHGCNELNIRLNSEEQKQLRFIKMSIKIVSYDDNNQKFKSSMLKLADEFEKIGL